jgi:thiamine biosynthesis lipoprotein
MTPLRRMRPMLGTFVEVGACGPVASDAIEAAFATLEDAQAWWSFHAPDSELSRLNRAAGARVHLRPQTLRLLRLAVTMMRRSESAFDCTVGGLLVDQGVLPDHGGPAPLPRGRVDDIEIGAGWARLRRPVRLTLDGIAKGYAVDRAIAALRRAGAPAGSVNAGGDLRVYGELSLPVQRRELDGRFTSLGVLREAAVASSRVATPGATSDPSFPAQLVAPAGQHPQTGVWTVLARSAWRADALTKVAANTAAPRRDALVRSLGGCLLATPPLELAA